MSQHVTASSYRSFLVKLWQEETAVARSEWRGEVVHIQSGAHRHFASLVDLLEFRAQQAAAPDRAGVRQPDVRG